MESRDVVLVLTYTCDVIVFTVKVKLQLNATNEIVAADAASDNTSSSLADIFEVRSHTLIDNDRS